MSKIFKDFLTCLMETLLMKKKPKKKPHKPGTKKPIPTQPVPIPELNPKGSCLYVEGLNTWFSPSIVKSCAYKWYTERTVGQGIKLAVLDDGLVKHRLLTPLEPKIIRENFTHSVGVTGETDIKGHGTHTASLLIGPLSLMAGDVCTGLCPGVDRFYHLKVLNNGIGFMDDIRDALQYIIDLPAHERPHFISFSIAATIKEPYADDVLLVEEKLKQVKELGVRVLACSGNAGVLNVSDPLYDSVTYPGRSPYVKAIGAVDLNENIARFSSRGNEVDYVSYGVTEIGYSKDGTGFTRLSGTSMATPRHVGFEVCFASWLIKNKKMKVENIIPNIDTLLREYNFVHDLGVPSKDPVFGLGLCRFG